MGQVKPMVGLRFGRLVVESRSAKAARVAWWVCRCDCGTQVEVSGLLLRFGSVRSCGCLSRDILQARNTKHGHAPRGKRPLEYRAWQAMIQRCTNPSVHNYHRYGGRGISVCARWLHDFPSFLADMGPKPSRAHSIERKDNAGNYEPGNCCWATATEQAANRRPRVVTHCRRGHLKPPGRCPICFAAWMQANSDRVRGYQLAYQARKRHPPTSP